MPPVASSPRRRPRLAAPVAPAAPAASVAPFAPPSPDLGTASPSEPARGGRYAKPALRVRPATRVTRCGSDSPCGSNHKLPADGRSTRSLREPQHAPSPFGTYIHGSTWKLVANPVAHQARPASSGLMRTGAGGDYCHVELVVLEVEGSPLATEWTSRGGREGAQSA